MSARDAGTTKVDKDLGHLGVDPDQAVLDEMLRSCVSCGLCLPSCATYIAAGNEASSPRGRLHLLGQVLGRHMDVHDRSVARIFDSCLRCMACSRFCPSGVRSDLMDYCQTLGYRAMRRNRFVNPTFALLSHVRGRRFLDAVSWHLRWLFETVLGSSWQRRMAKGPGPLPELGWVLGALPVACSRDEDLVQFLDRIVCSTSCGGGPLGSTRVGLFKTRNSDSIPALMPRPMATRLRTLLDAHGCREHPVLDRLNGSINADCRDDRKDSDELLEMIVELLVSILPPRMPSLPLQVAVHDPCGFREPAGITEAVRNLLGRIEGLRVLKSPGLPECCGGTWPYAVRYPGLSKKMGLRQAEILAATCCRLVVVIDPACFGPLSAGLALAAPSIPAISLTDLLWYTWIDRRE